MKSAATKNTPRNGSGLLIFALSLVLAVIVSLLGLTDRSAHGEVDCLTCHGDLAKKKVVHAALQMGCPTCHSAIDATDIPHKKTNTIAKGLSSEPPELCYGCHDKNKFEGKVTHPPVMGGMCTSCHNPHSSDTAKLLLSEPPALCFTCHEEKKFKGKFTHSPVAGGMCTTCHSPHKSDNEKLLQALAPDLCFNCHDKAGFSKQNIHPPVAGGMCLTCHGPHASDYPAQLLHKINDVCIECHTQKDLKTGLHVISGFGAGGHPVKGKKDPKRTGKEFACSSCHDPHSSEWMKLFRYKAQSLFELCQHCHEK